MSILKYAGLGLIALLFAGFAMVGFLYMTRGTPLRSVRAFGDPNGPPAVGDSSFAHTAQLVSDVSLWPGHEIDILLNGDETYPRLWQDLRSAQTSITLQIYSCQPGAMADTLRQILLDRAKAGVKVLFLLDAFGSQELTDGYLDSLRTGSVRVAVFRPVHWYSIHKASHRSHIRVVVVDGRVGYTGGFGIDDKWLGDGRHENQWRDTNVRFRGRGVLQLQATFAAGWAEATGELLTGEAIFPEADATTPDGTQVAGLMHAAPTIGSTAAERFLAITIAGARKRLYVSNSYFVPDDDFRRLLVSAGKRGVDVRILTAGERTDVKTTWLAGRDRYEELLEGGVRIYEYQPTMMHAKTFVADGLWGTVGTMNFDNRSLAFNDESNLVALDTAFGQRLEEVFVEDLRYSKEITLPEFRQRGVIAKMKERTASLMSRLL